MTTILNLSFSWSQRVHSNLIVSSRSCLAVKRPSAVSNSVAFAKRSSCSSLVVARSFLSPRERISSRIATRLSLGFAATVISSYSNETKALCNGDEDSAPASTFDESYLEMDHYSGVTVRLDTIPKESLDVHAFKLILEQSLAKWKDEGKKGIWIHCPKDQADKVPVAVELGFDFHMVTPDALVLTSWLPDTQSRLPHPPTHQVGIGCLILHPKDPTKMLVVQEKTGPAAAWSLWKVPTGLTDPMEDIPAAAIRELKEETGLDARFEGILAFRQSHRGGHRAVSDLFFVCVMDLLEKENITWETCPDEIAAIQWMPITDYCDQEVWQSSPTMLELNRAVLEVSQHKLLNATTLELGFGGSKMTNVVYKSYL